MIGGTLLASRVLWWLRRILAIRVATQRGVESMNPGSCFRIPSPERRVPVLCNKRTLFVLLTLMALGPTLRAQTPFGLLISEQLRSSFTLTGSGARAAGMGGAFTAIADDATAASFNPAGLAQLVLPEASFVLDHVSLNDRNLNFQSLDQVPTLPLTDTSIDFHRTNFNFLSFTLPFSVASRNFSSQFSTQKAVDFSYRGNRQFTETFPDGTQVALIDQSSEQSGAIRVYSASFAAELTDRILAGVSINRWSGSWDFTSLTGESSHADPGHREFLSYRQSNSLSGWNYDLGVLFRYKYLNVGLRYRTPFTAELKFHAEIDTNIETPLRPLPATTTQLNWPSTFTAGIAVKPSDRMTVTADYGRTNWANMHFEIAGDPAEINFFDLQPGDSTKSTTTRDLHLGIEYLFFAGNNVIPVRAGWLHEPQPARDQSTSGRIVRNGFALGGGLKRNWFAIDFAYQRRSSKTHISSFSEPDEIATGNLIGTSIGDLKRTEDRMLLSMIFQIPRESKISDIFHIIFIGPKEKGDPSQ